MDFLPNGVENLNSRALIAIFFLIATIAGWYAGHLILWLRR